MPGRAPVVAALALALTGACAPPSLLERAVRARGGPLAGVARTVEAEVYAGFPGTWRWRTVLQRPERYAWTIVTADEPHHYLYDGDTVRAFVGGREVAADPAAAAPLRSHARFTALANLDAARRVAVRAEAMSPAEVPAGAAAGVLLVLADGTAYRLGFDTRLLLVWMSGPVSLDPFGAGELVARFADFRRVRGYLLPFRTAYDFRGQPLAVERALAVCPNPAGLDARAFATPAGLPVCE